MPTVEPQATTELEHDEQKAGSSNEVLWVDVIGPIFWNHSGPRSAGVYNL
jgi:hypothetical protein